MVDFVFWFFIFIDHDLWEGLILIKKCQAKIKSCLDFLKIFKGSWACALILIKKKGDRKSLLKSKKLNQYLKKWLLDLKKHLYLSKINNFGLKKTHQNQNAPNPNLLTSPPYLYSRSRFRPFVHLPKITQTLFLNQIPSQLVTYIKYYHFSPPILPHPLYTKPPRKSHKLLKPAAHLSFSENLALFIT